MARDIHLTHIDVESLFKRKMRRGVERDFYSLTKCGRREKASLLDALGKRVQVSYC